MHQGMQKWDMQVALQKTLQNNYQKKVQQQKKVQHSYFLQHYWSERSAWQYQTVGDSVAPRGTKMAKVEDSEAAG